MAVTSLREAQKALTRERLLEAAKSLFYRDGYWAVTLDQIAKEAGTQRTTLYAHFKDKDEILRHLAEEYAKNIIPVLETISGPTPSRAEIDRWMLDVAKFVRAQKTPTVMFAGFGVGGGAPEPVARLGYQMYEALARKLPAFRGVHEKGQRKAYTQAWAGAIARQLSFACLKHVDDNHNKDEFEAALGIAGDLLEMYLKRSAGA